MLYLLVFAASCLLINCAEVSERRTKNKPAYWFLVGISLLLTAAMAGLRDYTVGADVLTYGNGTFYAALRNHSLISCLDRIDLEDGYVAINYFISRFTDNLHWFYFIIALLMNIFVFAALHRYKKNNAFSEALGMFIYYCTFYNQSLNILRQSLAVAIFFLAISYMFEKKYIKYTILCIAAALFHISAIICILFLPIYVLIKKYPTLKMSILIIAGSATVVAMYAVISEWMIDKGIFPEKYIRYIGDQREFAFKWDSLIVRLPILLFGKYTFKQFKKTNYINIFLTLMIILEIVFMQLAVFVEYASRISIYVMAFRAFLLVNMILTTYKENKNHIDYGFALIVILYVIVVWFCSVIIQNNNFTYPYTSAILGIS